MSIWKRFGADLVRVVLAAVLLSALSPAAAQVWKWSQTAGTNGSVDPHINFSEGQAPSSLNDSARALMAEVAKYRDDISGALETGGTSSAFTLATNQGFGSTDPATGQVIAFRPHATNASGVTLKLDSGSAYPIQSAPGVAIGADTLIEGTPYAATFDGAAWVLRGFFGNPYAVPLGSYLDSSADNPPNSNFVKPAGQCISRTTYATYFALVGTRYGACDGTSTFGVPDFRGRAAYAIDNLNGSAANRMTNATGGCGTFTTPGATCATGQSATLGTLNLPPYTPVVQSAGGSFSGTTGTITGAGGSASGAQGGSTFSAQRADGTTAVAVSGSIFPSIVMAPQGGTSQPFNVTGNAYAVTKFLRVL